MRKTTTNERFTPAKKLYKSERNVDELFVLVEEKDLEGSEWKFVRVVGCIYSMMEEQQSVFEIQKQSARELRMSFYSLVLLMKKPDGANKRATSIRNEGKREPVIDAIFSLGDYSSIGRLFFLFSCG